MDREAILEEAIYDALTHMRAAMLGDFLSGTEFRNDNGLDSLVPAPEDAIDNLERAIAFLEAVNNG